VGGKAAILLVLGFSLVFMVAGSNFNRMSTDTVDNMAAYFYETKAHHIASAGVNIVANKVFLNNDLPDGNFNYNFDGGAINVNLVTIDPAQDLREITAVANYRGVTSTIRILLKPSSFSKYAYFSDSEGANIWWTTRDTVWGPFHTNGQLRVADEPVFYGKVTIDGRVVSYSHRANPHFYGGLETGVHKDIPEDGVARVGAAAVAGGKVISGESKVYLEFRGDSVRYRFSTGAPWNYELASTFAPNGVIYVENAELHVSGTVKGQYTVGVSGTGSDRGKIFLEDDIVCSDNPETNPNSNDVIGLVAKRDVVIANNTPNSNDIVIQAAIYSERGSFTVEDYQHGSPRGTIKLYGGITQYTRGPVGQFTTDWWGNTYIRSGYNKRYRYDDRLMLLSPPAFPGTGGFEIVSWFE
jgi:hypothetical protein